MDKSSWAKNRRMFQRYSSNITCKVKSSRSEKIEMGRILDISRQGARVEFQRDIINIVEHQEIMIECRSLSIPSVAIRSWETGGGLGTAVIFQKEIPPDDFESFIRTFRKQEGDLTGTIVFRARASLEELTYLETLEQLMTLFVVVDSAYWIYTSAYSKIHGEDILLSPPKLLYLHSHSPIEGAINTSKEVVNIVKSADDIIRNRAENKEVKKEEVLQVKEKSKQQKAITTKMESDAFIKLHTRNFEVIKEKNELLKQEITLKKEEIALMKETLSFVTHTVNNAKELFGEDSEEFNIIKKRLLPHYMALTSTEHHGMDLAFTDKEKKI